ncbi:hypothetical protein AAC387_Pa06g0952 [Persea americana]
MSTQNRRFSASSSSTKRPGQSMENAAKVVMGPQPHPKKRAALTNLTNQSLGRMGTQVSSASTTSKHKKGPIMLTGDSGLRPNSSVSMLTVKQATSIAHKSAFPKSSETLPNASSILRNKYEGPAASVIPLQQPCATKFSPSKSSDDGSVSLDETMSTCDSLKSPDIEYVDNEASAVASLERRTCQNLYISEDANSKEGHVWKRSDILMDKEIDDKFIDVDHNRKDPQLCASIACDIYKHLRMAETKKRPSTDFMETVQKDINASMRAILVDWLVEVAEEYRLVPDTLYLTVNYIDRYLSGNIMNRQQLQLLGVSSMLIAAKYEEICAPQVEEFCYITDNTYLRDEVLQMESSVLNYLKFEMTAPTVKCFLRRFVQVAQAGGETRLLHLEFLANYVAELSLLEYSFLCYAPSLIAASAIFVANFISQPSKRPWNATLQHYTLYKPSELCSCVNALHNLFCDSHSNSLPAIREKYSQHKYKFVAKKCCPSTIPLEFFYDLIH